MTVSIFIAIEWRPNIGIDFDRDLTRNMIQNTEINRLDHLITRHSILQAELHSHQLFMAGQHDMISIGGGGGNGIYLDGTLSRGKTESCKTFGNPPLCTSKDFDIAAIEVFGLAFAD